MERFRSVLTASPARITAAYLVFGFSWILVTDWAVLQIADEITEVAGYQLLKGWTFVLLSGGLIYWLVSTRETQLQRKQDQLRTATEQLQVLSRVFRHDVRNKLQAVLGYIDQAERELSDEVPVSDDLERAERAAAEVISVSDKMQAVDSTSLDEGAVDTVDLVAVIETVVDHIAEVYPSAEIETDLPDSAPVFGTELLETALYELMANAIEHTDDPTPYCRVTIDTEETTFSLCVIDRGPGIPEHERAVLESAKETQLAHLSGVGLWVVTWICRMHDADLTIASRSSEQGTEARISFDHVPNGSEVP